MPAIAIPAVDNPAILKLKAERDRLQARHDELLYTLPGLRAMAEVSGGPYGDEHRPRYNEAVAELRTVSTALSDTERTLRSATEERRSEVARDFAKSADYRRILLAALRVRAERLSPEGEIYAARVRAYRAGIVLPGLPTSLVREVEELVGWARESRRIGLLDSKAALPEWLAALMADAT